MRIVEIVKWVSIFMPVLDFPKWSVCEEVRLWTKKLLGIGDLVAAMTVTIIDDKIVDAFQKITVNQEAWNSFYMIIKELFYQNKGANSLKATDENVVKLADTVGLCPILTIAVIGTGLRIIRKWNDRNKANVLVV